ncbi:MAG: 50S ribosomal protein L10 [Kiritimatiellaeota bacterium]|nr:50S ribosomal protein L10 [Kiritimatiellota bacterium]
MTNAKPKAHTKRVEKISAIGEITGIVNKSDFGFVLNYGKLTVANFAQLRAELATTKSKVKVVKNTYLAKAAEEKGWTIPDDVLAGPTALITGNGDPAEVAKSIVAFLKKFEKEEIKPAVKGAQLDKTSLNAAQVDALSKLPSKDVMRATLLGTMLAPATSLVRVFAASITSVLYVLKAKADKEQPQPAE